ncbi:hypothetical protein P691DRAFT_782592 [Macrolepiota fuliginosa MF-IS2]|uniref:Uncharacterized protein n=1 Tax=Macrolepiota fuliginosa MF-IS2 TaxID=1400762 RepID=A0A9P5XA67_9AGAR|nr:hypothetical protein P691DRAFT_782592 [Macrolepiota fuliginosa MF-IS2]
MLFLEVLEGSFTLVPITECHERSVVGVQSPPTAQVSVRPSVIKVVIVSIKDGEIPFMSMPPWFHLRALGPAFWEEGVRRRKDGRVTVPVDATVPGGSVWLVGSNISSWAPPFAVELRKHVQEDYERQCKLEDLIGADRPSLIGAFGYGSFWRTEISRMTRESGMTLSVFQFGAS